MQPDILELHRQATVVSRRKGYEVRKRSYEALARVTAHVTCKRCLELAQRIVRSLT